MRTQVEEVARLRARTSDDARPEAVDRQHAIGKLTARERIDLLFDSGTFRELGGLGHHQNETPLMQNIDAPGDGIVVGWGRCEGRIVCCASYDFTVLGGSMGSVNDSKMARIRKASLEYGYPLVFFLEGGGARVQERMGSKATKGHDRFFDLAVMSGWVPIVAAVVGPTYAGHANLAGIADYVPMVNRTSSMGLAGPRLIQVATGEVVDLEELGGAELHCCQTGMADARFDDERELITSIRSFLDYLPSNAQAASPVRTFTVEDDRLPDSVLDLLPNEPNKPYDMRRLVEMVADPQSLFELKSEFAPNLITSLARIRGKPIGVIANNPICRAGVLDTESSDKMAHFISLCDAFSIPLLFLVDVPGYIVGTAAERTGLVRHSMKPLFELGQATVPKFTVLVRKAYGLAYHAMGAAEFLPDLLVAWPTAEVSPMGPEGAVNIVYGRDLSKDPVTRETLVMELRKLNGPLKPAQEMRIDDIIDPRDTRVAIAAAMSFAPGLARYTRARPPKKHGINPV
jgi:acetyl-CoA carboxylase carboxyltransferase component